MSTPAPEIRLATVVAALREIVIPALPASEVLAAEQAGLCVSQLSMLAEQLGHLPGYEASCLESMSTLGRALVDDAQGGAATTEAAETLRRRLAGTDTAADTAGTAAPGARQRRNAIGGAVDDLVRGVHRDGTDASRAAVAALVVRHGADQAARDRTWFQAGGMDPDPGALGTIAELVEGAPR